MLMALPGAIVATHLGIARPQLAPGLLSSVAFPS
jgi:hypothetical protein